MASSSKTNVENDFQLEEGPLEESETYSLDLTVSTRYYNLQVEETVEQMNNDSAVVEADARSLGDRIVFSPGGNEGYLFMETRNENEMNEKQVWPNNNQTPRVIDERIFLERDITRTEAMASHVPDEAYNSLNS